MIGVGMHAVRDGALNILIQGSVWLAPDAVSWSSPCSCCRRNHRALSQGGEKLESSCCMRMIRRRLAS